MESNTKRARTAGKSYNQKYKERSLGQFARAQAIPKQVTSAVITQAVKKAALKEAMKNAGYVDYQLNTPIGNGAGAFLELGPVIRTGSGIQNRIGAKIKWKSIQIRGHVYGNRPTELQEHVSLMFIYDRKPAGAPPAVGSILTGTTSEALINDDNRDRFLVLRRLDYKLQGAPNNANGMGYAIIDEYFKLKGLEAEYTGAQYSAGPPAVGDGQIGDFRTGAIYILAVSDEVADGATRAVVTGTVRFRFADVQG